MECKTEELEKMRAEKKNNSILFYLQKKKIENEIKMQEIKIEQEKVKLEIMKKNPEYLNLT